MGLLLVCGYYRFRAGGHQHESIVTLYSPPRDLSPAMLRFIWKERFDDRTFWACVLSLVSKGLATFEEKDGETFVRSTDDLVSSHPQLSGEETVLVKSIFQNQHRKRVSLNADANTAVAMSRVSQYLHQKVAVARLKDTLKGMKELN